LLQEHEEKLLKFYLSEEQLKTLTPYQKMVELAYIREQLKKPISNLFGF